MLKTQIDATCDKHFTLPRHDFNNKGMFTLIEMLTNRKQVAIELQKERVKNRKTFCLKKLKMLKPYWFNQGLN